ncbi:hypothetical protein [Shinella sp. G-2]|uniref:hypothetical protein n=1 Tax=Shinella sp. G-2 TaxID=3133141 RepID=UPI003D071B2E
MEGIERHTAFEIESLELIFQFVARRFGSVIVPQAMVDGHQRAKTQREISPKPPAATFQAMVMEHIRGAARDVAAPKPGKPSPRR